MTSCSTVVFTAYCTNGPCRSRTMRCAERRTARCREIVGQLLDKASVCADAREATVGCDTHSVRSAFIGASDAARVAGTTAATKAVNARAPAATVSATGSQNATP
jgi:hypothetical protein